MAEIYGPYDHADWYVMLQLRKSVKWMSNTDYGKYQSAINKETDMFKRFRNKEVA